MVNFNKSNQNPLQNTTIKKAEKTHIKIKDVEVCRVKCENKPCTYYCPSRVFYWSDDNRIKILYERCIECGACPWGCPYNNISWQYPPGGYGVSYDRTINN